MKFLIIGHSVLDIIHHEEANEIKAGGIYYTLKALKAVSSEDEVYLCSSMEKDLFSYFEPVYRGCKLDYLTFSEIPKVNLYINPGEERCEVYSNLNTPLSVDYAALNNFDGILINMITGFDITIDTLAEIRKNFNGLIYMDVHTLSRGVDEKMQRHFRKIEDFYNRKENISIIQVNEHELFTISTEKDEMSIARDILLNTKTGIPEQLIITKGELGARVFYKKNNEILSYYKSALKTEVNNTIGLGDTFGAVYFYTYFKAHSVFKSLDMAVLAGGYAASGKNFNQL